MKKGIHPELVISTFECACGNKFEAETSKNENPIHIEVCSECHPFYTGKQGSATQRGNVEKFNKKYGIKAEEK